MSPIGAGIIMAVQLAFLSIHFLAFPGLSAISDFLVIKKPVKSLFIRLIRDIFADYD